MPSLLLTFLREQRKIFVVCPHCEDITRLSDAKVSYRKKYKYDWLDKIERTESRISDRFARLEESYHEKRKKHIERARKKILPQLLRKSVPKFYKQSINPQDVKPLFDPIDFVAFDGMNSSRGTKQILFLDHRAINRDHKRTQESIKRVLKKEFFAWTILRISKEGAISEE